MSKRTVTRLFVGGATAVVAGSLLELALVGAALAGGVVEFGGSSYIEVHGGAYTWTLVALGVAAVVVVAVGATAGVVSWIGALLNTMQLEDKTWFASLLVLGVFSLGTAAMVAYVLAGPDGTRQSVENRRLQIGR